MPCACCRWKEEYPRPGSIVSKENCRISSKILSNAMQDEYFCRGGSGSGELPAVGEGDRQDTWRRKSRCCQMMGSPRIGEWRCWNFCKSIFAAAKVSVKGLIKGLLRANATPNRPGTFIQRYRRGNHRQNHRPDCCRDRSTRLKTRPGIVYRACIRLT